MARFPTGSRLLQLRPLSKEPATTHAHLDSEPEDLFVETNPNVALVLGTETESQWIVIDIDKPNDVSARELWQAVEKAPTRLVETPHGVQAIYASPPTLPRLRASLDGKNGTFGELLSHGYVVGPGASVECNGKKHADGSRCGVKTYRLVNDVEPAPAPPWLVELAEGLARKRATTKSEPTTERNGVPFGSHDKAGADLAYNLRRWLGLSEESLRAFFAEGGLKGLISCLEGYNPGSPFTQADAERWARSAARKTASGIIELPAFLTDQSIADEEDKAYADHTFVEKTLRWLVRGFVPIGYLVALYGAGGRGKSTFGSWLVGEATKRGMSCALWCIEESPDLFAARAVLGGADRRLLYAANNPSGWLFPRDLERLATYIKRRDLKFLWFDSLYSNFEYVEGANVSERARKTLGPIALLARETECTIMGVFHENKGGAFLGATEMENVPRVMLKASRNIRLPKSPLKIKVWKTNMPFRPTTYLRFEASKAILVDSWSGEIQMEEVEPGKLEPLQVPIANRVEDGQIEDEPIEEIAEAALEISREPRAKNIYGPI